MISLLAAIGGVANRAAGSDDTLWFSGKIWNAVLYAMALLIAGHDYTNWMVIASIPAYYLLRQMGRGAYVHAQVTDTFKDRIDQPWVDWMLRKTVGKDDAEEWGFFGNTIMGSLRGLVLGVLLMNPFMVLCCLQGLAFWMGDKTSKDAGRAWEWGEYYNGVFIFTGVALWIYAN